MTYTQVIQSIANNLLVHFEQVYHSAETVVNDKDLKIPAIPKGTEWIDLSPSDQRETIYIRRAGDDSVYDEERLGSCGKGYKMQTPLRIVYFRDHVKNHQEIIFKLLQASLTGNTKLKSVSQDKWKLLKEESSGDYKFDPTTAYYAIDINALWTLIPDNCEQDFCVSLRNPLIRPCNIEIESPIIES